MSSKKVLVILSSVRDGRHADKVGNAVMNHLKGISNLEAEILGEFCIFIFPLSLCSRKFQNVKLRLDFVQIWSFYRHSNFT